jgi:hypothetical protein
MIMIGDQDAATGRETLHFKHVHHGAFRFHAVHGASIRCLPRVQNQGEIAQRPIGLLSVKKASATVLIEMISGGVGTAVTDSIATPTERPNPKQHSHLLDEGVPSNPLLKLAAIFWLKPASQS